MDIFKIVGTIALDGQEAFDKGMNSAIKTASSLAKTLGKGLITALTAASGAMVALGKAGIDAYSNYEQLAGGMEKIFSSMDTSIIAKDAAEAYKYLGMSASDYLAVINDVGAAFSATMGAEAGYEVAKKGLTAISDYASGTGKNFDELQGKFAMITRSTSSYQSIADQFSGILPATSKDFLAQAQACGFLDKKYRDLTKVPIAEYQQAVADMLEQGVENLNLTGNTAAEAAETISGSLGMAKAAWQNLLVGFADGEQDLSVLINNFVESVSAAARQIVPRLAQILGGLTEAMAEILPLVTAELPVLLQELLPGIIEGAVALVSGLVEALPMVISVLFESIKQFVTEKVPEMFPGLETALSNVKAYFEDIGSYISEKFAPIMADIQTAFDKVKEKIQPIIDKLSEYVTSGEAAEDASNLLKDAVDFIAEAYATAKTAIDDIITAFESACTWVEEHQLGLEALAAALGVVTAALVVYNVAQLIANAGGIAGIAADAGLAIGYYALVAAEAAATAGATAFGAVMAFITSPITLVTAAIAAVIAIVVLCVKHWDEIKAKAIEIAGVISAKWEEIKTAISEKIESAVATVTTKFNEIKQTVESKVNDAKAKVEEAFNNIKQSVEDALNQAKATVEQIWNDIKSVFSDARDAGKQIIDDIKQGISDAWEGLKEWFGKLWDGLFGNLNATVNVDKNDNTGTAPKPQATGLNFVPYDEYPALLHQGEAVLNAVQARAWRRGDGNSSISQDVTDVLLMILDAVQEGNNRNTVITLNNREFGRAVRGVVNV